MSCARLRFHVQGHNQGSKVNLRGLRGHLLHTITFLVLTCFTKHILSELTFNGRTLCFFIGTV